MEQLSSIQLQLRPRPSAVLLWLCRPQVRIGAITRRRYWGTHTFDVLPGDHSVRVSVPYFGMSFGPAEIPLAVEPGATIKLRYDPPGMFNQPGRLTWQR
jgi:hypothetical protein